MSGEIDRTGRTTSEISVSASLRQRRRLHARTSAAAIPVDRQSGTLQVHGHFLFWDGDQSRGVKTVDLLPAYHSSLQLELVQPKAAAC